VQKPSREKHREKRNEKQKEYFRKHRVEIGIRGQGSKVILLKGQSRPKTCSICGKSYGRGIQLHHFSENPLTGIWVCLKCHNVIHADRTGLSIEEWFERYQRLKANPIVIDL